MYKKMMIKKNVKMMRGTDSANEEFRQRILDHYDVEEGAGNAYKFLASWKEVIKVLLFGWDRALTHLAVLHYGFDHTPGEPLELSLRRLHGDVFHRLGVGSNSTVLDAGCGVGGMSLEFAQKYPAIRFIGVSLSPGQISVAKKRAHHARVSNATYLTANYLHLPQKAASFDGITAVETLCYVPNGDKRAVLAEFYRVLKPGGRLVVYDGYINPKPETWKLKHLHAQISAGWSLPNPISTASYFLSYAKHAGFQMLTNDVVTTRVLSFSKAAKQRVCNVMVFVGLIRFAIVLRRFGIRLPLFSHLGLDHPAVLGVAYTTYFQYDLFAAGDIEYRIMVLKKP